MFNNKSNEETLKKALLIACVPILIAEVGQGIREWLARKDEQSKPKEKEVI